MIKLRQTCTYILVSLMVLETIGIMVSTLNSVAYASDDIYLVNTNDTKVLRVPYLHQDGVNHCWLYSVGMVVAYYGKEFNPNLILNRIEKGFDVGLHLLELDKLNRVTKDLYGIEFSYEYFALNFTKLISKESFKDLIVREISNGKPVLLLAKRHAVVITGYHRNTSSFYLVVNDPSGYLTYDVWKTNTRFDGSVAEGFSDSYGLLVDIDVVYQSLTILEFMTAALAIVKSAPAKPNPPKAVIYAYTTPPNASTELYNSDKRMTTVNYTRFYHNNYLNRSLWYPLPAAALGSHVYMIVYVYPNINRQEELYLDIEVTNRDTGGATTSISDRMLVKIHNVSYAKIFIPSTTKLSYSTHTPFSVRVIIPAWSVGSLQIELKLREKDKHGVVHVWGPVNINVYHELAYLSVEKLLMQISVTAGVLYGISPNDKQVDLYFSFWQPNVLGIPITRSVFQLTSPCNGTFIFPQPDPSLGGYYYVCSVRIPRDKNSIDITGAIIDLLSGVAVIPVKEVLTLPSAGTIGFASLNLRKVSININGTALFEVDYCVSENVLQKYKIAISVNSYGKHDLDLGLDRCGKVVAKVDSIPTTLPSLSVSVELLDELGNLLKTKFYTILNPLMVSVSDIVVPADITSESHTFIRFNISVSKKAVQDLYDLSMSALIYANGSELTSSTWLEKIVEEGDNYVMLMRSDIYAPPCKNGAATCTYVLTVIPRAEVRCGTRETVYVHSYDAKKEHIIRVYSKPLELKRTALLIVIDVSGSMGTMFRDLTKLDWAKEAAIYLINMTFDGDYIGIIAFSSLPTIVQDMVEVSGKLTREALIEKILGLRAGGNTNIGDSLKLATDLLSRHELLGYRRVIVLLTDGMHNIGTDPQDVLGYVKESGVVVYTIGLGEPGDIDEDMLNKIAYETGGKYYYAPTPDKLQEIFTHIRGEALALNLIGKEIAVLDPYGELWKIYPMDLQHTDFIVEVNWDSGSEPVVMLRFLSTAVTQANASVIGIQVSRPVANVLRFTIPKHYDYANSYFALASHHVLPINISIINVNPHSTTVEMSIFGGREAILEVIIDNPTARYLLGQYLYYRVITEKNRKVQVALTDRNGNILHLDVLTSTGSLDVHSGTINHYLKLPEKPGEYYLKVSLFDIFILRTKVIPITVVDLKYQDPIDIKCIDNVEGFGLMQIPVNITFTDPSVLGKTLTMQVELNPRIAYAPLVTISPRIIKITDHSQNAYIYVNVPYDAISGEYNLSLILTIEGHSTIVKKNVVRLRVPTINIVAEDVKDTIYVHQGDRAHTRVNLKIVGSKRYNIDVELRALFGNQIASIEGLPRYRISVHTNSTASFTIGYNTNAVGVYPGILEASINGTPIVSLRQTLVVLPKEADANKTIWIHGCNLVILGPDAGKNIGAQLKIDWKSHIAGMISVPAKPRSEVDYMVYAYSKEGRAKALLTVHIPQRFRQDGYALFIEKGYNVSSIPITSRTESLSVYIDAENVYRVWLEAVHTANQTRSTVLTLTSPSSQTQPIHIIGGAHITTTPASIHITATEVSDRLPIIATIIVVILVAEIEIILVVYLLKKRGR